MSIPYVSFDLEIATIVPEEGSWDDYRPLGISCAATYTSRGDLRLWCGEWKDGEFSERMTPGECQDLVAYLTDALSDGYRPLTWNGASFDFRTLYEECALADGDKEYWLAKCVRLALAHYDPAFQMLCEKGFMVGLKTAAEGLGVAGKTEGMSGALAPKMWAEGCEAQDMVLEYFAQDVRATAAVWEALHGQGRLPWVSRSGRANEWEPRSIHPSGGDPRMLMVDEAWRLPYPDTSWMSNPRTRGSVLEWTGQVQVPGRTVRQKRAGIEWRDVTKRVVLPPFTRGTFAGEQLDKEYCLVAFDEPVNQVLKVEREAIDL
jgi:hypothetical protein